MSALEKLFSYRFLSAVLFPLIAVPVNAAPPTGSTPPTHYRANTFPDYAITGQTPDVVARDVVSYNNAKGGYRWENLQTCFVYNPTPGYASYHCPYEVCRTTSLGTTCTSGSYRVEVWALCGSLYGASFDGGFYCPPEPDCDGPAQ